MISEIAYGIYWLGGPQNKYDVMLKSDVMSCLEVGYFVSWHATCFHTGFLFYLFFEPKDGGDIFLRNFGRLSTDYM
jgi:hypothetical protein